jgi:hypothetical protein
VAGHARDAAIFCTRRHSRLHTLFFFFLFILNKRCGGTSAAIMKILSSSLISALQDIDLREIKALHLYNTTFENLESPQPGQNWV